jgi:hypothetical protein
LCLNPSLEFIWQYVLFRFLGCVLHKLHNSLLISVSQLISVLYTNANTQILTFLLSNGFLLRYFASFLG